MQIEVIITKSDGRYYASSHQIFGAASDAKTIESCKEGYNNCLELYKLLNYVKGSQTYEITYKFMDNDLKFLNKTEL